MYTNYTILLPNAPTWHRGAHACERVSLSRAHTPLASLRARSAREAPLSVQCAAHCWVGRHDVACGTVATKVACVDCFQVRSLGACACRGRKGDRQERKGGGGSHRQVLAG